MDGVAALMRRQFGVVSRRQVLDEGVSIGVIRARLSRGEWVRVFEGVYASSSVAVGWWARAAAAVLVAGPGSALSHVTAGHVLGLESMERPPSVIDVSVPAHRRVRIAGITAHQSRLAIPSFTSRGLQVTTLARTFVDLAGVLDEERLEFALDSAHRRCRRLGDWLEQYLSELDPRGHAGIATLVKLLRLRRDGSTESPLEVKVWRALRRAGIDVAKRQHVIRDRTGAAVMRADFAWPSHRIALHVDSASWHLQEQRMTKDAEQRTALQALGWFSMPVTHSMLKRDDWLTWLREQLTKRAPQFELSLN